MQNWDEQQLGEGVRGEEVQNWGKQQLGEGVGRWGGAELGLQLKWADGKRLHPQARTQR